MHLGSMYIWNYSVNCNYTVHFNVNKLKRLVRQLSIDQFIQKWSSEINNSNKCLCYRIYKQDFGLDKYLVTLPLALRIPYTRFRCRNNRLQVEIGSYENIDRELRLCNMCDMQTLGDEFHALIICPSFSLLPNRYLGLPTPTHPISIFKLYTLFNRYDNEQLFNLAKYIREIMLLL
jgi:hypothetical protein